MEIHDQKKQKDPGISQDPYGPSYPQSAAKFILYRIGVTIFAIIMIIVGKSNLPDDAVKCVQDVVIDWMKPVTSFYQNNQIIGIFLFSLMQLLVDLQLIAMSLLWYFKGSSFRYPIVLSVLGLSKILLNTLFQIRPIEDSFTQSFFPSLVFGQNFKNTYFFSSVTVFLLFNLLQLREMGYRGLMYVQSGIIVYSVLILLSMRQNFFMDVITALAFGHFVFVYVCQRSKSIDKKILSLLQGQSNEGINK